MFVGLFVVVVRRVYLVLVVLKGWWLMGWLLLGDLIGWMGGWMVVVWLEVGWVG